MRRRGDKAQLKIERSKIYQNNDILNDRKKKVVIGCFRLENCFIGMQNIRLAAYAHESAPLGEDSHVSPCFSYHFSLAIIHFLFCSKLAERRCVINGLLFLYVFNSIVGLLKFLIILKWNILYVKMLEGGKNRE
ncbi:hypothetical protein ABD72_18050 [Brevibacillus laterosporus]|nr:hypothetical protein BrL25_23140 [Brevibacillus laterosporus DSM 25]MBG9773079.1 hypothetical protein [Brevibacillus laterosporus]MBG9804022.1 hypothetical protein [Brevibacillus laterosporus]